MGTTLHIWLFDAWSFARCACLQKTTASHFVVWPGCMVAFLTKHAPTKLKTSVTGTGEGKTDLGLLDQFAVFQTHLDLVRYDAWVLVLRPLPSIASHRLRNLSAS